MNHWFHLVKKEIRLGLPAFLTTSSACPKRG